MKLNINIEYKELDLVAKIDGYELVGIKANGLDIIDIVSQESFDDIGEKAFKILKELKRDGGY